MAENRSPFASAVRAYAATPTKKKKARFVQRFLENGAVVKPDDVQLALLATEKENSQRTARRILRPIFEALLDYDGVIGTLAQADPMPSALIWGGLKALLECLGRYNNLYEKIEGQLKKLTHELRRLNEYEFLFSKSDDMQELLTSSYLNIIKFWARVEEQCSTSGFVLAAKSLTSFTTKKLDEILVDITEDSNNIAKLVPVVQERIRRGEQENAANERRKAGVVLDELLKSHQEEREARRRSEVLLWIRNNRADLNEGNARRQHQREKEVLQGTGNWLFKDASFNRWLAGHSQSNVLWLNGGAGVGKSIICARAVQEIRTQHTSSAVAFQYFSFDETNTASTVYRNFAEQLFLELYSPKEEISDQVYELVQTPTNERTLKELIKILVAELKCTYVLIDGLDEEYADKIRWEDASDVVSFFVDLASQTDSMRLWCSSQDRGKIRELMHSAEQIQLGASINSQDIETFFVSALQTRDYGEIDSPTKERVLSDLKRQVNGNFLWASLMLDTIGEATSLKELQAIVKEGLPEDFEKYLGRKIQSLKKSQHNFSSKVLSCLVYAKRPLFVEELCEAVEISDHALGQDLDSSCRVFRSKILDNCAPMVRVDSINTKAKCKEVCTLSHGSVKTFLVRNPSVLSEAETCRVSSRLLAEVCLKYLQQPRYRTQLVRGTGTFMTASKQDILDHHLLNYCAKYWHKHMDDISYSPELCKRVEEFVRSTNFATLVQVQSLFVGGQFTFWYSSGLEYMGRHLVRTFPRWFTEQHRCGEDLRLQYHSAVGEWGYYLDEVSTITGTYPGQMDRCLWGSLGKSNFLHKIPSAFKSFAFENTDGTLDPSTLFFEWVDAPGKELYLFKLNLTEEESRESQIICERWVLGRGRSPKINATYTISIPTEELQLYARPLRKPLPGRAALIAISEDGRLLRIGSRLYAKTEDFQFKQINILGKPIGYVDDLSSHRGYFAVSSRHKISTADLRAPGEDDMNRGATKTDDNSSTDSDSESQEESANDSSESGSDSDEANETNREEEAAEAKSETTSSDSLSIQSHLDEEQSDSFSIPSDVADFDTDSAESNSARESWSEGSTAELSDEVQDELMWNDYASDEDSLDVGDDKYFDTDSESERDDGLDADKISDAGSFESSGSSSRKSDTSWKRELKSQPDSESSGVESDIELHEADSEGSTDNDSDEPTDDESEAAYRGGLTLEQLLQSNNQNGGPTYHTSEIRIFKLQPDEAAEPIFRFFRPSPGHLFSSPPVFHPTQDLVVWPLGGDEVLFANFTQKTFFTRLVSSGYSNGCHISVQCRFSPCGQYLHMASLDGWKNNDAASSMALRMHVSTHRLSRRKPARSPPRMVFRTSVSLGLNFSETEKLSVSNLPYSLTWEKDHLYVSMSNKTLAVFRMPLFRHVETTEKGMYSRKAVFKNTKEVYLPASANYRKVHFSLVPPKESLGAAGSKSKKKPKSEGKPDFVATVILGPRNAEKEKSLLQELLGKLVGSERIPAGGERVPPQGVYLTAAQFGGWETAEPKIEDIKMLKRAETWRGGQLLAKFEKFDTSEDCDIIPYLGF